MDRRDFFSWVRNGLAGAAAASLLLRDGTLQAGQPGEASPPCPHFAPKATRAIHICLCGAMSHVDSFDYKPGLIAAHGQSLKSSTKPDVFFGQVGRLRQPDWAFRQRGQSGLWVSDLFPHLGEVADELTVIRSMVAETSNHTPATFQENSGFRLERVPGDGGLAELRPGQRVGRPAGVCRHSRRPRVPCRRRDQLDQRLPARPPPGRRDSAARASRSTTCSPSSPIDPGAESAARELVAAMNRRHLERHAGEDALAARIRGYELAARMQTSVPLVTDLEGEPAETLSLYGVDRRETADFGRACLIARRLLERGVRFVQLFSGGTFGSPRRNWDGHEDMKANHGQEALRIDRPVAGLAPRPAPPRDARRHARPVHHRVRPHAVHPVGRRRRRPGPRSQPVRLHRLAGRRRPQARHRLRLDRRDRLEGRRERRHLARLPCHRAAPAGHRPRTTDVLSQRNPAPADERPRRGRQADPGLSEIKSRRAVRFKSDRSRRLPILSASDRPARPRRFPPF